jgi:hypothetical protein
MVMCIEISGQELDKYFSIENFDKNPPGLYFENYEPTRLIGAEYKLITYLSLAEYNKKYNELGRKINELDTTCQKLKLNSLCGQYNYVITGLYNEVTTQRNHMYIALGYSETNTNRRERRKRVLINAIGAVMNTLFGVCDDNCASKANEQIKQIEVSGISTLHIMKSQTTVMKTAVQRIGTTIEQANKMYDELKTREKQVMLKLNDVANTTNNLLDLVAMSEIHNIYTALTNQYEYETSTINQIITAARGGIIHTSLITPQELAATLKEISHKVKGKLSILMGRTNTAELYELHKITKLTVFYENERLVFITKIPLITDTELILYNAIPIPMVRTLNYGNSINTRVSINLDNPYIAITKDRREYTTYTEIQIQTCKETKIYRMCHAYQPIQENNDLQPCEIDLFNKPHKIPNNCRSLIITVDRNIYHKLKYQNE